MAKISGAPRSLRRPFYLMLRPPGGRAHSPLVPRKVPKKGYPAALRPAPSLLQRAPAANCAAYSALLIAVSTSLNNKLGRPAAYPISY